VFLALFKVGQVLIAVILIIGQCGLLNLLEQRVFLTLFKVGKVLLAVILPLDQCGLFNPHSRVLLTFV